MVKKIFLAALFVIGLATSYAQTINKPRLDSLLNVLSAKNKSMGTLAISQNGKIVYQKSIGNAAIDSPSTIPASTKTKYRIGSISKMFTGVMVMQLVEEGKLTLETTLDKFYPQVPNSAKITIGMMLNHHSGLYNFTNDSLYTTYMLLPQTHKQMLGRIASYNSDFEPGSKGQYSNTNFVLLSYIIEKVTNKTYPDLVKERIVNKIGLKDTYYGVKTNTANNEAMSFTYNGRWKKFSETDLSIPTGAGAMVSTPADLNKFIEALFAGRLVKPATLELMKTTKGRYSYAMFLAPFKGRNSYGHGGAIDAYQSDLKYFPEQKLAVSYITNGGGYDPSKIMEGVLSICFNEPYAMPLFAEVKEIDRYIGVYASNQIPIKITITKDGGTLLAQATGQSAFPLEPAKAANTFEFDAAGVVMEFRLDKREFTLKQGGKEFIFVKEQK